MSMISFTESSRSQSSNQLVAKKTETRKILEEDEYLDRMARIIRRDFFSDVEFPNGQQTVDTSCPSTERSNFNTAQTPGTDRTQFSTTSSMRSRKAACSTGLNEFLEKYTSEDNAYFEKIQRKELKKHRMKYPWLYRDQIDHNKGVQEQLKLPSIGEQASHSCSKSSTKMIDWPYNPRNSLFYPPSDEQKPSRQQSTINYHSNAFINRPIFKTPFQPRSAIKTKSFNRQTDKIGIDGKLINGSEEPLLSNYSLLTQTEIPQPVVVDEPKIKSETNRFYIPGDSPRDELAHRVYQDKVANLIRTPKLSGATPLHKTPSFRKGYADFSFSPERVKNLTPSIRRK